MTKTQLKQLVKEVISEVEDDPMEKYRNHPLAKQFAIKHSSDNTFSSVLTRRLSQHLRVPSHTDLNKIMAEVKKEIDRTMEEFGVGGF